MEEKHSRLIGKIVEKYGSRRAFARELGISETTLSLKLDGKYDFKESEIRKTISLLEIPDHKIGFYFFSAN